MELEGLEHLPSTCSWLIAVILALTTFLLPFYLRSKHWRMTYQGQTRKWQTIVFHTLELKINNDIILTIKTPGNSKQVFVASIGQSLPNDVICVVSPSKNKLGISWDDIAKLSIHHEGEGEFHQYEFEWVIQDRKLTFLQDDVQMLGSHWYGLGHVWNHPWPMEKWDVQMSPVISGELEPLKLGEFYGGIQERLWLASTGVALSVDFDCPLFCSVNHQCDGLLSLVAKYAPPYQNYHEKPLSMKYTILQDKDVKSVYLAAAGRVFPLPKGIPDKMMFHYPVWSTWAQYKKGIDQSKVIEFAKEIQKHGFKASQVEIDDDWTPAYGDWEFDSCKFPDPTGMVKDLKDMGFRVTIWMHPFANVNSNAFKDKRYWITDPRSGNTCIVHWWNGRAAVLDVTNPESRSWLLQKCQVLKEQYGIDSFKIDAGEGCYLPFQRKTHEPLDNPNTYNRMFVELCHDLDPELRAQETRSGVGAQHVPMFFRVNDKDSNWSNVNGLKTVIPHVLNQGLLGYPFVLPDMIGGNAYRLVGFSESSKYPQRELFIRWIQVNALMPSMQFSIAPWMYDDEVVAIAQKMCHLHEKYSKIMIELAKDAVKTGAPICRPLWWVAPNDQTALTISTEFLLGDDVLVAPVLEEGHVTRDIYFPAGKWRDNETGREIEGGQWVRDYPADLSFLPYFARVA